MSITFVHDIEGDKIGDTFENGYYIAEIQPSHNGARQVIEKIECAWYPNGCDYDPYTGDTLRILARIDIDNLTIDMDVQKYLGRPN